MYVTFSDICEFNFNFCLEFVWLSPFFDVLFILFIWPWHCLTLTLPCDYFIAIDRGSRPPAVLEQWGTVWFWHLPWPWLNLGRASGWTRGFHRKVSHSFVTPWTTSACHVHTGVCHSYETFLGYKWQERNVTLYFYSSGIARVQAWGLLLLGLTWL